MERTEGRIRWFAQKAGPGMEESYRDFLRLAAQPLLYSADMLYKLWANFKGYRHKNPKNQPQYLVVSDLLLSALSLPIGAELFRMEENARRIILENEALPENLLPEIALFVEEYALRTPLSRNIQEIHSLWAMGILRPAEMEKNISEKLKDAELNPNAKAGYLNLYFNALPLGGGAGQKPGISIRYADADDLNDVLTLTHLPEGMKKALPERVGLPETNKETDPVSVLISECLNTQNRSLSLCGLNIADLKAYPELQKCTHLEVLDLSENSISDISVLQGLTGLKILGLGQNDIYNLSPLQNLTSLKKLYLSKNAISVISPLAGLLALEELFFGDNMVSDISPLAGLSALKTLRFGNNRVSDITPIAHLKNLETLRIGNNQITSFPFSIIENNPLVYLKLHLNPIENLPKPLFDIDGDCLLQLKTYWHETLKPALPKMAFVQGGTFTMGYLPERDGEDDENMKYSKPAHRVTLDSFEIGVYTVTNAQYAVFLNAYGSYTVKSGEYKGEKMVEAHKWGVEQGEGGLWVPAQGYENHPVVYVTWFGCFEYAAWLSSVTGKNYRLPTEAQWEYAARGGANSKGYIYAGSNEIEEVAWYYKNAYDKGEKHSDYGTHPVRQKKPNELVLYDMSGNVWEWCGDWYGKYLEGSQTNPFTSDSGTARVVRGGSWYNNANNCRVAFRRNFVPVNIVNSIGFRVCRGL